MPLNTIFDAGNQPFAWWYSANGFFIFAIGLALVFMPDVMQRVLPHGLQGRARVIFSWIFMLAGFVFGTTVLFWTYREYAFAISSLQQGNYKIAEGPVTQFEPMPASGHGKESFTVDGHRFTYSDFIETPGFHQTTYRGGPIRQGLYVRVTYTGNMILRLEAKP